MKPARRVRPLLLGLLWVWALLVFVVLDLFRNVPEFDRVRPKWRTYEGMRHAAHEMVGEPYLDLGPPSPLRFQAKDARERCRELRDLALRPGARDALRAIARDATEPEKVRAEAARCLGRAGDFDGLEALRDDPSPRIRKAVLLGYAELGTPAAVARLLAAGAEAELARVSRPEAVAALAEAAPRSPAACRALGNTKSADAVPVLRALLAKPGTPAAVRAAATESLGRLGSAEALPEVVKACGDSNALVAREARLAKERLLRAR